MWQKHNVAKTTSSDGGHQLQLLSETNETQSLGVVGMKESLNNKSAIEPI